MRSHLSDRDAARSAVGPLRAPGAPPERSLPRVARLAALLTPLLAALAAAAASPSASGRASATLCAAHEAAQGGRASVAPAGPTAPAASGGRRGDPAPDPCLAPEEVVGIVLQAFARNDTPHRDAGVATAFSFASPANRAVLGSVDRFAELVRDDTYRPLLYHVRVARGVLRVDGERATQRVVVTALGGERVVYTFTLSRQVDGAYKGCWMTDGVTREPPSSLRAPQLAGAAGRARRLAGLQGTRHPGPRAVS